MTNSPENDHDRPDAGNANTGSEAATLPAEALPPIVPPTGGFIMQLFLIPLIIVSIVGMVVLLFNWLAHMESDPHKLIDNISRLDKGSWQSAHDLSQLMVHPNHKALRSDTEIASKIIRLLDQQMDQVPEQLKNNDNKIDLERVTLRLYLCRVLGTMDIPDGVEVLIRAATTERDPDELAVRIAALESITSLAANDAIDHDALLAKPGLLDAVIQASNDRGENETLLRKTKEDYIENSGETKEKSIRTYNIASAHSQLRTTATFALGVLGGDEAIDQLLFLLGDAHCDVRFNAATGLTRWGNLESTEILLTMLEYDNPDIVSYTPHEAEHLLQQTKVHLNALHAVRMLVDQNPDHDFSSLHAATRQLASDASAKTQVGIEAKRLLLYFDNRQAATQN